jgi:hypothetical protein
VKIEDHISLKIEKIEDEDLKYLVDEDSLLWEGL